MWPIDNPSYIDSFIHLADTFDVNYQYPDIPDGPKYIPDYRMNFVNAEQNSPSGEVFHFEAVEIFGSPLISHQLTDHIKIAFGLNASNKGFFDIVKYPKSSLHRNLGHRAIEGIWDRKDHYALLGFAPADYFRQRLENERRLLRFEEVIYVPRYVIRALDDCV